MTSQVPSPVGESALDATALGFFIAQSEQPLYDQAVSNLFGYHAVQVGWSGYDLLAQSRIPTKHYLTTQQRGPRTSLLCESEYLPFAESSVDLVCLPHHLEQCAHPQQTLREIFRVLVPEGTLILTGVTPVSLLGLRMRTGRFRRMGICQRLFTVARIRDWCNVLGFELVASGRLMHVLPVNDAVWLERQRWLDRWGQRTCGLTGGLYYLVVKKKVTHLRLLKRGWQKVSLAQGISVQPSHSGIQKPLDL